MSKRLTTDQQEIWDLTKPHEYIPSDGQTPEQALHFAVESYLHACNFDGVAPPDEQLVHDEIARLRVSEAA